MNWRRILKRIHLASTGWLACCLALLLVLTFRQAGFNWWLIFSLSGHSALLIFLLIALYLFAVLETASNSRQIVIEHPLTSTTPYMAFYVSAPLLGGCAGVLAAVGQGRIDEALSTLALGTLAATFLTWVVIDPLTSLFEMLAPAGRVHRRHRIAVHKAEREKNRLERQRLLADLLARQKHQQQLWAQSLQTQAETLAGLLAADRRNYGSAQQQAIDIGAQAWQIGGMPCMRQLHQMAADIFKNNPRNPPLIDYISSWWDGIGNWRSPGLR